jgi:hypothetical protein
MVAYLDDWLIFGNQLPAAEILQTIQQLGIHINFKKSVLQPVSQLIYLGLLISVPTKQL